MKLSSIDRKLDRRGTASMPYSSFLFHLQFDAYQSCCFQFKYDFSFCFLVAVSIVSLAQLSLVTSAGDLQKGPLCRLHRATVPRQWINWIDFSYAILSCVNTEKQPCFFLNRRWLLVALNAWNPGRHPNEDNLVENLCKRYSQGVGLRQMI